MQLVRPGVGEQSRCGPGSPKVKANPCRSQTVFTHTLCFPTGLPGQGGHHQAAGRSADWSLVPGHRVRQSRLPTSFLAKVVLIFIPCHKIAMWLEGGGGLWSRRAWHDLNHCLQTPPRTLLGAHKPNHSHLRVREGLLPWSSLGGLASQSPPAASLPDLSLP